MIEFITERAPELLEAAMKIIGGFAVLATMTKNQTDNKVLNYILRAINFFGANLGRARNA